MIITTKWLKEINDKFESTWWRSGHTFLTWDGEFTQEPIKNYRISLCTTCMGRLEDLKKTLPQNIYDNADYPNVEFVLLDYNSNDGLGDWIKSEMMHEIELGRLVYYRTEEPEFYTMSHSRNVVFKLATGEIVNNLDADNFTHTGFVQYINMLANEQPEKAIFAKGKRMTRGRLGFYKKEFIDILGGYDESMHAYGHDERDLMFRAWASGFRLMHFGGSYYKAVEKKAPKVENYDEYHKNWRYTEQVNKLISFSNLLSGNFKANVGKHWGKAHLIKNFTEEIDV